jgi:hypothetical protein
MNTAVFIKPTVRFKENRHHTPALPSMILRLHVDLLGTKPITKPFV